ncbi:MAG TPA: hypothetical protein PKJ19_04520 [Flavobacteriales bacterium]|nr:hypothetical protein [Flavobacteriales bacterium]HNU55634.1 hypothetical protein [Flavobacteriales bacterium]
MNTDLAPEQSLKLIESMIRQAKRSFQRLSFYFLLWGVLLIAAMLATYLLRDMDPATGKGAPWGVAGFAGGFISMVYGARQGRRERVINAMDGLIGWLWASFVITMIITIAVSLAAHRDPGPMITLLTGIPTFMTGRIMRFRPLIMGGVIFWVAGAVMHFTQDAFTITMIYCAAMVLGYILPGLLLKRMEDGLRTT